MECWRCGGSFRKEGEKLEKWGNVYSCKFCADMMSGYMNGRESLELEIGSLPSYVEGRYDFVYGSMEFGGGFRESNASRNVSHESTHHILFRKIGLKACFQYDNISQFGDIEETIINTD